MALKSVYLPEPVIEDGIIDISGDEHRHLVVARAETSELVDVFDGRGHVWHAEVIDIQKRRMRVRIRNTEDVPAPAVQLILGQALIRMAAFELALEKAVEVGVTRIIPFIASRSNAVAGDRLERWQRIIVEAAKQSKRFHLPVLDEVLTFDRLLQVPAASKIVFAERDGGPLEAALSGPPALFLIGPEGGWTDEELVQSDRAGFKKVSLGAGILRSETASLVGAALIRYELEGK